MILNDAADAVTVSSAAVKPSPGALFSQTVVTTGAKLQRHESRIVHPGDGAAVRMDGIYMLDGRAHADLTSVVEHRGENGATSQLCKGVVTGRARAVFQGRIVVAPGADGTDARMRHSALIVSEGAEIDAKPELEIYADDVQCAHGNTIGALDDELLFYIRSRGVPELEARALLTEAFLGEVVGAHRARRHPRGDRSPRRRPPAGAGSMSTDGGGFGRAAFDVEAVRAQFPILQRQVNGHPLVYLDSAASAQKPRAVIDAMVGAMEGSYANVHRGLHTLGQRDHHRLRGRARQRAPTAQCERRRDRLHQGRYRGHQPRGRVHRPALKAGDEIVLSELEHHANILPWHFLRERLGVVLKFAPVTDEGGIDVDALKALIGPRTVGVAVTHMSNITGWRSPAREIADAAHAAGAWLLLDGCQSAVHEVIDVKALDCDFYVFSGHKLYGPTGIGVLYGKAERLAGMAPYQGGGEMIASVSMDAITYAEAPHRFEAGTPAILEAIGLGAACQWLMAQDRAAIAAHEEALYRRAVEGLEGCNWLRILGTTPGKASVLSFTVEGAHAHDVAQLLDRYGVAVRAGTHCAEPLMRRFGVTSSAPRVLRPI